MKRVLSLFMVFLILMSMVDVMAEENDAISVTINGIELEPDTAPYIKNDRTMVPMRAIFEALGASVTWDDVTKTACGIKEETVVEIKIGENKLYKNGEEITLDVEAEIVNGSTMVPVRAISEAFGAWVNWDEAMNKVVIKCDVPYGKAVGFGDSRERPCWKYENSVLTFFGEGTMPAYGFSPGYGKPSFTLPKEWNNYFEEIETVKVEEGVESIYGSVLEGCTNLKVLHLGKNVRMEGAPFNFDKLEEIILEEGAYLGEKVFTKAPNLKNVVLKGEASIFQNAFKNTPFENQTERLMFNNILVWRRESPDEDVIIIDEGIEKIGDNVFAYSKASSVVFPESLKSIGNYSFYESSLTSVVINCEEIGEDAFANTENLENITIGERVYKISTNAFRKSAINEIVIPYNVAEIEKGAFMECESLKSAKFDCDIKVLPKSIFAYCRNLSEVKLPDNCEEIGSHAFVGCGNMKKFDFPESLKKIAEGSFSECGFTEFSVPCSVTELGKRAFSGCGNMEKITIPDTITVLPSLAFEHCDSLKEVKLPETLVEIGYGAFFFCESLEQIHIPESVEEIGSEAFRYCKSLKALAIPEQVTYIPDKVAGGCDNLTTVIIKNKHLEEIGNEAFINCEKLWYINIPDNLKKVGRDVFLGTDLYVNHDEYWKDGYFILNNVVFDVDLNIITEKQEIPDGSRVLAKGLFENSDITEVVVPGSVFAVSGFCFASCHNLEKVTILDGVEKIEAYAFYQSYKMEELVIPSSVLEMEKGSPSDKIFTKKAVVPEHLACFFENMTLYNNKCEVVIQP